jgi:hypothetical protein
MRARGQPASSAHVGLDAVLEGGRVVSTPVLQFCSCLFCSSPLAIKAWPLFSVELMARMVGSAGAGHAALLLLARAGPRRALWSCEHHRRRRGADVGEQRLGLALMRGL